MLPQRPRLRLAAPGGMGDGMPEPPPTGSTRVRGPHVVVRYAKVRVEVIRGPDTGTSVDVAGQTVKVGTAEDNQLILSDDSVSRAHCELEPVVGGMRVRDVGSTNGVFAGGVRFYDAVLPFDSRLSLGDTELALSALTETVEREQTTRDRFGDLLGASPRMRELFADLERIAGTDVTLLVEGETGTGKDVLAESVHRASPRAAGPFVVFDCGAVSPTLVESELFGHERGAFTGATQAHAGVFEQADGGTLFLDEIGELPRELQPKLLRALDKRQIRRVGGTAVVAFDARVIAATNRQLRADVARDRFRQDLYFRLAAAHVTVPALRERMEDLPLLVEHFLSIERSPSSAGDLPREVWDLLRAHRWPGNVRELRNAVQRFLVTPDRALRDLAAMGSAATSTPAELLPLRIARREANDAFERDYVALALKVARGNVTRAAALAEVSRQNLQKLLKKHGRE
jgi:transcriptional regulator with PAS, ATPase and Fis domain